MPGLGFDDAEASNFRINGWWTLVHGQNPESNLRCTTISGAIDFDNDAARAILAALKDSPKNLADIGKESTIAAVDLLNTIPALWMANLVAPVDAPVPGAVWQSVAGILDNMGISIDGRASPNGAVFNRT